MHRRVYFRYFINVSNMCLQLQEQSEVNIDAPTGDGLFITDLLTGDCKLLVSLRTIALAVGLPVNVPTYGFHVKWSSDDRLIMFIIRTLEVPLRLDGLLGKRFRVQHLIVLNADGSNIRKLLSWSTKPMKDSHANTDGNHPNWVHGTHKISMNLSPQSVSRHSDAVLFDGLVGKAKQAKSPGWTLHIIDADLSSSAKPAPVYSRSSGHPTVSSDFRFAVLDAYSKEADWFDPQLLPQGWVPLRLVDLSEAQEVWALAVSTQSSADTKGKSLGERDSSTTPDPPPNSSPNSDSKIPRNIRNSWRCDLHPVWDRSRRLIAFNGKPGGGGRQVIIAALEERLLSSYFGPVSKFASK